MMDILTCQKCGKEFESWPSNERKYCSQDCFILARRKPKGMCPVCGKPSSRFYTKFCSSECYHKHRIGKPLIARRRRVKKICPECGTEYEVGGRLASKDKMFCSKECAWRSKWAPIDNQFNGSQSGAWRDLRLQVLERDNYRCLFCNEIENLQVHHRKPRWMGGTHEPENLNAICRYCHGAIDKVIRIAATNNPNFQVNQLYRLLGKAKINDML